MATKGSPDRPYLYHFTKEALQKVKDKMAAQIRELEKRRFGSEYYYEWELRPELLHTSHLRGC